MEIDFNTKTNVQIEYNIPSPQCQTKAQLLSPSWPPSFFISTYHEGFESKKQVKIPRFPSTLKKLIWNTIIFAAFYYSAGLALHNTWIITKCGESPVPEFINPVFTKTRPKRSFSLNRKRAFWLVFAKTGSIISGTGDQCLGALCGSRFRSRTNKSACTMHIHTVPRRLFIPALQ